MIRLDKLLSNMGFGSRKEVKEAIRSGLVRVNENVIRREDFKLDEKLDHVFLNDEEVIYQKYTYIMLNKPNGVVSATEDAYDQTVIDLLDDNSKDLFPIGRLDKDTVGLCLISNDGQLAHDLLSPKKHVYKKYYVEIESPISEESEKLLSTGITIDHDETCLPAIIKKIEDRKYYLTIKEGKYHQIKRMFQACGSKVTYLKRLQIKNLLLDENLREGEYRYLSEEEIGDLKSKGF